MGRIGVVVTETAGTAAVDAVAAVAGTAFTAATDDAIGNNDVITALAVGDNNTAALQNTALSDFIASETAKLGTGLTTAQQATVATNIADATAALATIGTADAVAAVAATAKTSTTTVDTRVQFDIAGSGEAQNGLSFGGKIRMRGTSGSTTVNGAQVMIGYGDLTVYGGNIPGVLESMPHAYANTVGYSGGTFRATVNQADTMAYTSTGAGANALQANFSMGSVSVAVAHQPSNDNNQASVVYSANGLTVALGGQFSNRAAEDETVASIGYAMGNYSFNVSSSDNDGNRKTSFGGAVDAGNGLRLNAYVTENESEADNAYGFGVKYDLGGATFGAAYETGHDKADRIEAGLTFSF